MILRLPHRGVIHLQMRVILRIKERVVVSRAHEGKILALFPDDRIIIPCVRGSNRPIERPLQPPAIGRNRSGRDQAGHTKNGRKHPCAFHFHQTPSPSLAIGLVNHINETDGRFLAAGLLFWHFLSQDSTQILGFDDFRQIKLEVIY